MNKIKVVTLEPSRVARIETVDNELHTFQTLVGGYIEVIRLQGNLPILIILNEEGKLMGLPENLVLPMDSLVGTVVFCADEGEEFRGLTDEEINVVMGFIETYSAGGRVQ